MRDEFHLAKQLRDQHSQLHWASARTPRMYSLKLWLIRSCDSDCSRQDSANIWRISSLFRVIVSLNALALRMPFCRHGGHGFALVEHFPL
jgi:hypothetical protein